MKNFKEFINEEWVEESITPPPVELTPTFDIGNVVRLKKSSMWYLPTPEERRKEHQIPETGTIYDIGPDEWGDELMYYVQWCDNLDECSNGYYDNDLELVEQIKDKPESSNYEEWVEEKNNIII